MSPSTVKIGGRVYRLQELVGADVVLRPLPRGGAELLILHGGCSQAVRLSPEQALTLGLALVGPTAGQIPITEREEGEAHG